MKDSCRKAAGDCVLGCALSNRALVSFELRVMHLYDLVSSAYPSRLAGQLAGPLTSQGWPGVVSMLVACQG